MQTQNFRRINLGSVTLHRHFYNTMQMKKLYAVCLLVGNFNKSFAFYHNTLGLTVNSQDTGYADFKLGDMLLAIFQKDDATVMFAREHMNSGGGAVYAYEVEDVEAACAELRSKGVVLFEGPKNVPWGQTVAYFKDPDGHVWEITK